MPEAAQYQLELRQNNLKSSIRAWKRCNDIIDDLLVDFADADSLRQTRDNLTSKWREVETAALRLAEIDPTDVHIESIECQTQAQRQRLNTRIGEINDEAKSTSKQSRRSCTNTRKSGSDK